MNKIILIAKTFLGFFRKKYKKYNVGDMVVFTYWEEPWTHQENLKRIGEVLSVSDVGGYYLIKYKDIFERVSAVKFNKVECKFLEKNPSSSKPTNRKLRLVK